MPLWLGLMVCVVKVTVAYLQELRDAKTWLAMDMRDGAQVLL